MIINGLIQKYKTLKFSALPMPHVCKLEAHVDCRLYVAKSFGDVSDFNALVKKLTYMGFITYMACNNIVNYKAATCLKT